MQKQEKIIILYNLFFYLKYNFKTKNLYFKKLNKVNKLINSTENIFFSIKKKHNQTFEQNSKLNFLYKIFYKKINKINKFNKINFKFLRKFNLKRFFYYNLFKKTKKFKNLKLNFFNNKFFYLLNSLFLFNFFQYIYLKKKKKKNIFTIIFKRRNFYLILHVYINTKLVYISCFDNYFKKTKFYSYINFLFSKIKLIFFKNIKFQKILFILKLQKKIHKTKKRKTKNFLIYFIFNKILTFFFFFLKNKNIIQIKYLFNTSQSLKQEKLKKLRRK